MPNVCSAFGELAPLVLICHAPPYGTPLDQVRPGLHAGSTAVRDFINQHQPEYFFCGHIHEAEGVAIEMGKTRGAECGQSRLFVRIGLTLMTLEELEREYQPLREQALAVRRYL